MGKEASSPDACSWGAEYGIIRASIFVRPSPHQQKDVSHVAPPAHHRAGPRRNRRVARAAFPKGHPYLTFRDALGTIFQDEDFAALFPAWGQPGWVSISN